MNTISRRAAARLSLAALGAAVVLRPHALLGQAAPAAPQFAVATIKPHQGDSSYSSGLNTAHGMLNAENVTLKRCIVGSYGVGPHQVIGGPDWVDTEPFDIVAKAEQPINDDAILNLMIQGLLADRFRLALHRDTRTLSAYVLEIDKKGSKLTPAKGGGSSTNTNTGGGGRITITARNTDMGELAQVLARKMDLPVVDQTGLTGLFDFKLVWFPDDLPPPMLNGAPDPNAPPGLFTAIQEQLGLHLRPAKAPVEVLVIDHAEPPSAN